MSAEEAAPDYTMYPELMNAPPRLSDLHGDDRTKALTARHRAATRDWLEGRQTRTLPQRMAAIFVRSWFHTGGAA